MKFLEWKIYILNWWMNGYSSKEREREKSLNLLIQRLATAHTYIAVSENVNEAAGLHPPTFLASFILKWPDPRGSPCTGRHGFDSPAEMRPTLARRRDSWEAWILDPSTARYTSRQYPISQSFTVEQSSSKHQKPPPAQKNHQSSMFSNNSTTSQLQAAMASSGGEEKSWNDWPVEMDPLSTVVLGQL